MSKSIPRLAILRAVKSCRRTRKWDANDTFFENSNCRILRSAIQATKFWRREWAKCGGIDDARDSH